jgi:hypothetical protein
MQHTHSSPASSYSCPLTHSSLDSSTWRYSDTLGLASRACWARARCEVMRTREPASSIRSMAWQSQSVRLLKGGLSLLGLLESRGRGLG